MRNFLLELSFIVGLAMAATGGASCGDNHPASSGRGGSSGSAGSAGAGGLGAGGATGAVGSTGMGGAGNATGAGGASTQSPEEIHELLINAQTTGGIEVTRPQPTVAPPACQ